MSHRPEHLISDTSVKQSQNKLRATSNKPAVLTLNTTKHGELVELSIDRFSLLTKQPKRADSVSLYHYTTIESDLKKRGLYYQPSVQKHTFARSQAVSFKWTSERMPWLKVRKVEANAHPALTWKESLYIRETNPVKQAPVKTPALRCLRFK